MKIITPYTVDEELKSLLKDVYDVLKLHNYKLNLKENHNNIIPTNISDLVYQSLSRCRRIMIGENDLENKIWWDIDIDDSIIINCNKYYTCQAVDSLIIHAIQWHKKGEIAISLRKKLDFVTLTISNEGDRRLEQVITIPYF